MDREAVRPGRRRADARHWALAALDAWAGVLRGVMESAKARRRDVDAEKWAVRELACPASAEPAKATPWNPEVE